MGRYRRTALRTARVAALVALCAGGAARCEVVRLDCRANSADCPPVVIEGDPFAELEGFGSAPFRGYGDPSVRKDPGSDRLWMSYSFLDVHTEPAVEFAVSQHLASSDDSGQSWQFRKRLARSEPEVDPTAAGGRGVSVHEVSTIAPLVTGSRVRWFGMHLRYFQPFGPEGRRPQSFLFPLVRAKQPKALSKRKHARLGGSLADPAWDLDLDLSTLDPEIAECAVWTEPALFGADETLYLVAQCLVIDETTGARRPKQEFIGVFASSGKGSIRRLDWRWLGKLTTRADAKALGGKVLSQPDLAWSRDGRLLLLVTPKRFGSKVQHRGCRVLEVASLEAPRIERDEDGAPVVLADIRSSDSTGLGPGLCAYDPASETGVLFVRTEVDLATPDIVFRLHATGIHP